MEMILCSADDVVRRRWQAILAEKHEPVEVADIAGLQGLIREKDNVLVLLHRLMLDVDTAVQLQREAPGCKFFIFADRPNEKDGLVFLKIGAVGYANTYMSPSLLTQAIDVVGAGRVWVGRNLMKSLVRNMVGKEEQSSVQRPENFSDREWDVAQLVAKGMSNLEIAAKLDIAERTVKAHLSSIFKKTDIESRLQLALALRGLAA